MLLGTAVEWGFGGLLRGTRDDCVYVCNSSIQGDCEVCARCGDARCGVGERESDFRPYLASEACSLTPAELQLLPASDGARVLMMASLRVALVLLRWEMALPVAAHTC